MSDTSDSEHDVPSASDSDEPDNADIDIVEPDDTASAPHVVIITGMSGSGKSTAVNALEDVGFFCIDNLPVPLLPKVLELAASGSGGVQSLAFVIDTRERMFLDDAEATIRELRAGDAHLQVVFLEADPETLFQRFSETRRRHPMSDGGTLRDALQKERDRLAELRALADDVVDTTEFNVHELKSLIQERFSGDKTSDFIVTLVSFGYKHGLPAECDLVFDVRFLQNPYFVEELRDKDGRNSDVQEFVLGLPESSRFISHFLEMADFMLPAYEKEGKTYLTIGIGCTGGHHRSVSLVEALSDRLATRDWNIQTRHRDVDR